MLKTVEIEVRGGEAVVTVIPEGVQVVIRDYDIDGWREADLLTDGNGDIYSLWSSPGG